MTHAAPSPLAGRTVLITRASDQAATTAAAFSALGAHPVEIPTLVVAPPEDAAPLARAARSLARYDVVALTSGNGVEALFGALAAAALDARALEGAVVAAIGPSTARALAGRGARVDVVAEEHRGEGLAAAILEALRARGRTEGARVLLARAAIARDALPSALRAAGVEVDDVAAYRTTKPEGAQVVAMRDALVAAALEGPARSIALFTASSTVDNLCALVDDARGLLEALTVATLGPLTSASCRAHGVRVDVEARPYTIDALIAALEAHFSR